MTFRIVMSVLFVAVLTTKAFAYIGPGIASGAVGAVLGVIGSVFLALFAVIWYPIKRLVRRIRGKSKGAPGAVSRDDGK